MMDEKDSNSDPSGAMVTAMEELWQNQFYIPIKGWGAPFTSPDHYTDLSGNRSFSNWDFPDLPPLPGWKWTTKWTIDTSHSFGSTDSDGWAYETTFDRLVDSIRAGKSQGTNATTSIVRRRRFIRMRTCVTAEATAQMRARTTALLEIRNKFEFALTEKKTNYALTMQYERERKRICGDSWKQMSDSVKECYRCMQSNVAKLEYIKQYYQEVADAEKEYSKRLTTLCSKNAKWENNITSSAASDCQSEAPTESSAASKFESGDCDSAISDFYSEMNGINSSLAGGLKGVSNMITNEIFQVLDSNVKDMKALLQDLKSDINSMEDYKSKEDAVQKTLTKMDHCFYAISKADEEEVARLNKVLSGETTDDPVFMAALSKSAKSGEPVEPDVYSHFTASTSKDDDMWTAHYNYRQAVNNSWKTFNQLEKSVNKASMLKVQCNQAACIVFTSTRRMFMKEQAQVWSEVFPPSASTNIGDATSQHDNEDSKSKTMTIEVDAESQCSDVLTPLSDSGGDAGGESFVFERTLPELPTCTSILKEGVIRYCSGEETRKAIVSMTTNLGGKSPGGTNVTGIPWESVWGILSSDGVVHLLTNEQDPGVDGRVPERVLLKSIPVRGSEIIVHSSDFGLFPLMVEIVPKNSSLMDSVMQGRQKDAYLLGANDQDTERWFTAIMQPIIGAVYARSTRESLATKKKSGELMMSPHRKNSLTPGSSAMMTAAAAAANSAGDTSESSSVPDTTEMRASGEGEPDLPTADKSSAGIEPADSRAPRSPEKLVKPTATVSPNTDTALKRSESALLEAAKLAEGWRLSEADGLEDDGILLSDGNAEEGECSDIL